MVFSVAGELGAGSREGSGGSKWGSLSRRDSTGSPGSRSAGSSTSGRLVEGYGAFLRQRNAKVWSLFYCYERSRMRNSERAIVLTSKLFLEIERMFR